MHRETGFKLEINKNVSTLALSIWRDAATDENKRREEQLVKAFSSPRVNSFSKPQVYLLWTNRAGAFESKD